MKIYVDADACPKPVKEILYRVSDKRALKLVLVANSYMRVPLSTLIESIVVSAGADEADDKIVELVEEGDVVITADIPLADRIIKKKGIVLDPRGELLDDNNIGQRLGVRNLLDELRTEGMDTGGPSAYGPKDKQKFANQLDRLLTKIMR
ncbi:MAG: YaiI/YqxD family protein [Fibrobacterales bacterium]